MNEGTICEVDGQQWKAWTSVYQATSTFNRHNTIPNLSNDLVAPRRPRPKFNTNRRKEMGAGRGARLQNDDLTPEKRDMLLRNEIRNHKSEYYQNERIEQDYLKPDLNRSNCTDSDSDREIDIGFQRSKKSSSNSSFTNSTPSISTSSLNGHSSPFSNGISSEASDSQKFYSFESIENPSTDSDSVCPTPLDGMSDGIGQSHPNEIENSCQNGTSSSTEPKNSLQTNAGPRRPRIIRNALIDNLLLSKPQLKVPSDFLTNQPLGASSGTNSNHAVPPGAQDVTSTCASPSGVQGINFKSASSPGTWDARSNGVKEAFHDSSSIVTTPSLYAPSSFLNSTNKPYVPFKTPDIPFSLKDNDFPPLS